MGKKDLLSTSIKQTLLYSQLFSFPLRKKELYNRLITPPSVSFPIFKQKLKTLIKQGKIKTLKNYYFLPGREKTVNKREQLTKNYPEKYQKVKKAAQAIAQIPQVSFIGLTGNLALGIAQVKDDLDLMIITKPNSLWLTRFKVYCLLKTKGKKEGLSVRKPKSKESSDQLCLNLFLDSTDLALKKSKQNLFAAYQIALIKPLINKNQTFENFLSANYWVLKYLPHAFLPQKITLLKKKRINPFNHLCFFLQKTYMKGKQSQETVSLTQAFFHPHNKASKIIKKFSKENSSS